MRINKAAPIQKAEMPIAATMTRMRVTRVKEMKSNRGIAERAICTARKV